MKTNFYKDYFNIFFPLFFVFSFELSNSLINTFFISSLGENQLAGVGLAFAFKLFIIVTFSSFASALSVNISRAYGSNKTERMKIKIFIGFLLSFLFSLIILSLVWLFSNDILSIFNSNDEVSFYLSEYFNIWIYSIPLFSIISISSATMNSTGNSKILSIISLFGILLNIIFDYALIFGIEGYVDAKGVAGAALAGNYVMAIYSIVIPFFLYKKGLISFYYKNIPKLIIISKKILSLASHFLLAGVSFPISVIVLNSIVSNYSVETIAAFGLISRMDLLFLVVSSSSSSTINILSSKFYGAKQFSKINMTFALSNKIIILWGLIMLTIFFLFGREISSLFLTSKESIETFYSSWLLLLFGMILFGLTSHISRLFTSLKAPKYGTFIILFRNISIILFPFFISKYFGFFYFILSIPIINFITLLLALYLYSKHKKRLFSYSHK